MKNRLLGVKKSVDAIIQNYHPIEYKWVDPKKVVISHWVRMKCLFGCDGYGSAPCPPHVPSIEECRDYFNEYECAVLFRFTNILDNIEEHRKWVRRANQILLGIEKEVFFNGYPKVFMTLMSTCRSCEDCPKERARCQNPILARPTPEALGVDVFMTARKYGFPIRVLRGYSEEMNRYAVLLIQ
jgi:predicted metal-binding protein